MQTRIVIRDNVDDQVVEVRMDLSLEDRLRLNQLGRQVTDVTDWGLTLLALDPPA